MPEEKKQQSPKVRSGGTGEVEAKEEVSEEMPAVNLIREDDCIAVFSSDEDVQETYQQLKESTVRSVNMNMSAPEQQFQSKEILKKAERLPLSRKIKLMNVELKMKKRASAKNLPLP